MCRLAQRIVIEHLDRLAMRDVPGLARSLGVSEHAVSQAADCIRRLQPRPGWRFGAANTRFVTPDVVVRKIRGNWTVTLNPSVVPKVRLNRMYADLFQSHRDARHSDLAAQLQEARWTVRNVEQRFATILRVAQAIVQRQRHFLDYGELAMKPSVYARDCRRTRIARVHCIAGYEQQVHGHSARRVRVEVFFLARVGDEQRWKVFGDRDTRRNQGHDS